ncbi:hypothetical protein [Paraburkholderia sp. SIMBA_054]|jgi:hypothetical protein|uniref:hypothetical protein n=1 Tax=Paraburkholderia sp. SIMBA_054 TaxID=3085795 RepID=UPI00397A83D5
MQDFAYLFGDSAAAWLRGRGDARFPHYERHYRAERQAMPETFDLETANEQYAKRCEQRSGARLLRVLDSKAFKHLVFFLIMAWGGSLLLTTVGKQQPVAAGVVLLGIFVAIRIKRRREQSRRR